MDDLRARIRFQRDCNILCLTETWLTPSVLDTAVTPSDNLSVLRMDRTAKAIKTKGGGVCFMINKKWCDPRSISILSHSCSPHLEHLSLSAAHSICPTRFHRSLSLLFTFHHRQTLAWLCPNSMMSSADTLTKNPDAASIIAGDFNKASLRQVMPNFHQHISCPTRGPNTLDHCYTQFIKAYNARSLPAFGKSDHAAIVLTPVEREVTRWSSHSEAMLQAALDDVDWDMFRASSSDVSEFTDISQYTI